MKPFVCLPVPMDDDAVWQLFKPFIQRFCDTWRKFPPGCDCDLIAVVNNADATNELHEICDGLPVHFIRYDGNGADAASWQLASQHNPGRFMVASTSRTYFFRAGWLNQLVEARRKFGPGIYSTSASKEGGTFHLCIRFFGIDTDIFNEYPHQIDTRDKGCFFEIGRDNPHGPLGKWVSKLGAAYVVYWDYTVPIELAPIFFIENGFRDGNQEQMLGWDKHTSAYAEADEKEKSRLRAMMRGEI